MSERLGIDRSYLAEIESGKIEVCLRNLALIAQGVDLKAWQPLKFDGSLPTNECYCAVLGRKRPHCQPQELQLFASPLYQ